MTTSPDKDSKEGRTAVGVIGLGQIGGSLCAALSARGEYRVVGFDTSESLMQEAQKREITHSIGKSCADLIRHSQIVVLATPQSATIALLKEHVALLREKELVTDTGSLKEEVCAAAQSLKFANFVGGHPIAGSEKRTPEAWDKDLFDRAIYFYCPTTGTDPSAVEAFHQIAEQIGSAPKQTDAAEHDRLFALTSGLPHSVAIALQSMLGQERASAKELGSFVGPSFRSATRVAQSDPELIRFLLWDNRTHVSARLDWLIEELSLLRDDLKKDSPERLNQLLSVMENLDHSAEEE